MSVNNSDFMVVNRNNKNYAATVREVFPPIDDIGMLPGPPVIAIGGAPQMNPEVGDLIEIFREGSGELPRTNQWQRNGLDIVGETGDTYTIVAEDLGKLISLKQTFNDGEEQSSNEIKTPEPPMPWDDYLGGIWHVKNASDSVALTGGPFPAWDVDGKNERQITSFGPTEELVFLTSNQAAFLFTKNLTQTWEFGDITDTSSVTNMMAMFDNARAFNSDISGWDVGNVTRMTGLFYGAKEFNQDIGNWNVSNVTAMDGMFEDTLAFNQNLNKWDVSNVTYMAAMFALASVFNGDISNWDVSNVTDMSHMFNRAEVFNQDISTKEVTTVDGDTYTAWNTSNAEHTGYMLAQTKEFDQDIGNWDVSNVTNMQFMFSNTVKFNQDIGNWDVSNVTDMQKMFENAAAFNQDLSGWCVNPTPDIFRFDADATSWTEPKPCWGHCPRGENGTVDPCPMPWEGHDGGIWHITNVTSRVNISGTKTAWTLDGTELGEIDGVEVGQEVVFVTGTSANELFAYGQSAEYELGPLTDTSKVTDISLCFLLNRKFKGVGVEYMDVSNVTDMTATFTNCDEFNGYINDWDTSNVTNMIETFTFTYAFNQDISGWDVSKVTYMNNMFNQATAFNQDLSQWCVTNITSEPRGFATGATAWTLPKPVWGTCPRGEDQA